MISSTGRHSRGTRLMQAVFLPCRVEQPTLLGKLRVYPASGLLSDDGQVGSERIVIGQRTKPGSLLFADDPETNRNAAPDDRVRTKTVKTILVLHLPS